ncbi:hypothetical protein [Nocardia sp. NPDC004604]|uniref:hypothetical protein n=1 Tax=Nocardia sp. NPDC004604 TaxID=3157013 RepID=UPI00339FF808
MPVAVEAEVLDSDFFQDMMEQPAVDVAAPLLSEESRLITELANAIGFRGTVAGIGDATQTYRKLAMRLGGDYVCIDPRLRPVRVASAQAELSNAALLLSRKFGQLDRSNLPAGAILWIFPFNLYSYLPTAPDDLKSVCRVGDVVVISAWSDTPHAIALRKRYDSVLAEMRGSLAPTAARRIVAAPLPRFAHYGVVRGNFVNLYIYLVRDRAEIA